MRTETTTRTLYKFDKLSTEGQEKAVERLYDINVGHDWWDCTECELIELGCEGPLYFDLGRGESISFKVPQPEETAQKILKDHGETCETFKTAKAYLDALSDQQQIIELADDSTDEGYDDCCDAEAAIEELNDEFTSELQGDYLQILRSEYEYLTSEEAIIETIYANDYEFTEGGELV